MKFNLRSGYKSQKSFPFLTDLDEEEALFQGIFAFLNDHHFTEGAISPATQWFLDNYYLVEHAIDQIRRDMPLGPITGLIEETPNVYKLALEILHANQNIFDIDQTIIWINEFQLENELRSAEIWALPTMFRRGIIRNLAQAINRLLFTPNKNIAKSGNPPDQSSLSYANEFINQNPDRTSKRQWEPYFSARKVVRLHPDAPSTDEQIVINCLRTLRILSSQDWKAFFEALSPIDKILRNDPAGIYEIMDFDTRDHYRKAIEDLGLAIECRESVVARASIDLAKNAVNMNQKRQDESYQSEEHVGHYIIGRGRHKLEDALSYLPDWRTRRKKWARKHALLLFLGAIALIILSSSATISLITWSAGGNLIQIIGAILLVAIPIINIATLLIERISSYLVQPKPLLKLDFSSGIPSEFKTMVVIPAILGHPKEIDSLLDQIERHYLANSDNCLAFGLLTDFLDAPHKHMPDDQTLLDRLIDGVQNLNDRHSQNHLKPFYLFHRGRTWNQVEGCWMGWERKRGKLLQFNRLLKGEKTSFEICIGDQSFLSGIRYIITLDSDTVLPRESARRLVATLAHPLNQSIYDRDGKKILDGYTMLQPRINIHPASLNRSRFSRIFTTVTGLDLYTRAVSDFYQDIFGEGIFVGKGIYELASFQQSLDGRIPENTLISHDLIEGLYGRVGFLSDVVLYEEYPPHYLGFIRRLHRWVRGDWQLIPWLFNQIPHAEEGRETSLFTGLDRWKIWNNLFHSLQRPALCLLLVIGWLSFPGQAWVWPGIIISILGLEYLSGMFAELFTRFPIKKDLRLFTSWGDSILRWLMAILFLPFEAWVCSSAIISTLFRMFITRKHLLRWTSSNQVLSQYGENIKPTTYWRQMLPGPLFSLGILAAILLHKPHILITTAPLLLVWFFSPQIAWWVSQPLQPKQLSLDHDDRHLLRKLALRTWSYFEHSIDRQTNWLPPDNLIETPSLLQVFKTSPTNIGLTLLSTLAAGELGFISLRQMIDRLEKAVDSLDSLPRYNGHFYNWYDIRELSPVPPYFISVVDSGNLAACLLTLQEGLNEISSQPFLGRERWQGIIDALAILGEYISKDNNDFPIDGIANLQHIAIQGRKNPDQIGVILDQLVLKEWPKAAERLLALKQDIVLGKGDDEDLRQISSWIELIDQHLQDFLTDAKLLAPWVFKITHPPALFIRDDTDPEIGVIWKSFQSTMKTMPSLDELISIYTDGRNYLKNLCLLLSKDKDTSYEVNFALNWCLDLEKGIQAAEESARKLHRSIQKVKGWIDATFNEMDFGFLFDRQRKVFSVGYKIDSDALELSSYDLLASEARLSSLIAISKNDVPQDHWINMNRPIANLDGKPVLLSWGGSLFEYLMPSLFTHTFPDTLLDAACRMAISLHINCGKRENIPWGLSESSCYPIKPGQGYPYRSFGIKELAVDSNTGRDQVIAPYATALALTFHPKAAIKNIERLIQLGMLGRFGFYDAIDFSFPRQGLHQDKRGDVVPIYMTHHQGMIMLSILNILNQQVLIHRFHADPHIQTVELLLWEAPILRTDTKL